jgi:hypothetical protein
VQIPIYIVWGAPDAQGGWYYHAKSRFDFSGEPNRENFRDLRQAQPAQDWSRAERPAAVPDPQSPVLRNDDVGIRHQPTSSLSDRLGTATRSIACQLIGRTLTVLTTRHQLREPPLLVC